jgi:phosphate transport system permease protein
MEAATGALGSILPPTSPRRRRADMLGRAALGGATFLALVPLVLILYYLVKRGIGVFSVSFFTTDPSGAFLGDTGGIKSAILGTIEIVGFAALIAIPTGLGVALYLTEYGAGRLASTVRFFIDVMTGVPSIVFGLFIYITLVVAGVGGTSFAGWKGSLALAILMLPIVTRSCEVVLYQVPDSLREAALALGAPRWKVVARVIIPTALPGIITGSILAVSRAAGETAPLLFTAAFVSETSFNLSDRMNSLPLTIFQDLKQPRDELVNVAWGAALTLVLMVLVLTLVARLIQRRTRVQGAAN